MHKNAPNSLTEWQIIPRSENPKGANGRSLRTAAGHLGPGLHNHRELKH